MNREWRSVYINAFTIDEDIWYLKNNFSQTLGSEYLSFIAKK